MVVRRLPHPITLTKRQLDAALTKCYEGGVADGRAMVQDERRNKKNEQKWRMIRQKYEKEPKNIRAKQRRMKATQCMKAMKAKAKQCKKAMKAQVMKAKAVIGLRGQPTCDPVGAMEEFPEHAIDVTDTYIDTIVANQRAMMAKKNAKRRAQYKAMKTKAMKAKGMKTTAMKAKGMKAMKAKKATK